MRRITEVQHRGRKREKKVEQQEGETKRRIWEEVECNVGAGAREREGGDVHGEIKAE